MRPTDLSYSEWLMKLGNGELKNNVLLSEDIIKFPSSMMSENTISDIFGTNLVSEDIETSSK